MTAEQYFTTNENSFITKLIDLLRLPSISANKEGINKTVEWLDSYLSKLNAQIKVCETRDNPIILAEWNSSLVNKKNTKYINLWPL